MELLKKYRYGMNLTACAIEFMKMVGADLHIRPRVESSHKENRRLGCRGGFVYPPVNRRHVLQNFNLIACRTLQNAIPACATKSWLP